MAAHRLTSLRRVRGCGGPVRGRGSVAFGKDRFQRSADFGEFFGLVDLIVRRAYCRGSVPVLLN